MCSDTTKQTFIRSYNDESHHFVVCQLVAFGGIKFEYRYEYNEKGVLLRTVIAEAD